MQKDYERLYHELELHHWWFVGRRNALLAILERFPKNARILEIGCSGGALLLDLKAHKFTCAEGLDISRQAIAMCRARGLTNVALASAEQSGKESNSFDVIVAADILEHIADEKNALQEWRRILKPEGTLILFVPAFAFLWSEHDVINQHKRRYRKDTIVALLNNSGFLAEQASYWLAALFLPIALIRLLARLRKGHKKPRVQLFKPFFLINAFFVILLNIENALLFRLHIRYPFGVSVFVRAKKR